jgi:putative ABC transport system substrate-binding protein
MKTSIKTILLLIALIAIGYALKLQFKTSQKSPLTVHLVIPLEHQSLQDIVAGFKEALSSHLQKKVSYKVHNAQGDVNLQRSILQKLAQEETDLIVPVGTNTTQLTLKLIKNKPILSLAAMYKEEDRAGHQVTGVLDEIELDKFVSFLQQLHPIHSQIVLIHSTDDRRMKDALKIEQLLKTRKLLVKRLLIHTLNDLYTISHALPKNTYSVVILKDHLVVSGITALTKICDKKKIMLVTSDEGTVKSGASLGFGLTERDIGKEGGKIAAQILNSTAIQTIPIKHLSDLKVFANPKFLEKNKSLQPTLEKICHQYHYQLVTTQAEASK